ncbi:MAG: hypothetical protein ACE5GW_10745 [Planctomycetota bacterium]
MTAALLFGFGLSLWREAVLPGVQALTLLLLTALFVTVEQWLATRSRRWLLLTFCLLGLGGLHHGSFLAPAVIAAGIALMRRRAELRQKGCARTAASGALLGLLPILYLPLAVARTPYLCWGGPTHLPGVLPRLIGGIWWGGGGAADLPAEEVTGLLGVAVREHGWMGILLALLGALVLGRRFRGNLLVLLALLLANPLLAAGAGFLGVGQGPLARPLLFCLPSLLVLATLQAHGLDLVLQRYGNGRRSLSRVVTAATACLPLLLLATNARQDDYSRYRYGEDLGRSILASLPENGILITGGDWRTGLIHYCQGVRGDRPDVVLADPRGHLLWDLFPLLRKDPRHGSSLPAAQVVPDLLERGTRPIFSTEAGESGGGVRWEPYGLLFRALRDEESAGASVEAPVTEDPWARIAFGDLPSQPGGIARWLRDPPSSPPLDPPARRIAASYFEALLRRHRGGEAREAWSEVETLLAAFPR